MINAYAALTAAAFLPAIAFVILYAAWSPEWSHSSMGRNLMAKAAVLAFMLGLSLLSLLVRIPAWVWLGGMALLGAVLWWRLWILWRLTRPRPRGSAPDDR